MTLRFDSGFTASARSLFRFAHWFGFSIHCSVTPKRLLLYLSASLSRSIDQNRSSAETIGSPLTSSSSSSPSLSSSRVALLLGKWFQREVLADELLHLGVLFHRSTTWVSHGWGIRRPPSRSYISPSLKLCWLRYRGPRESSSAVGSGILIMRDKNGIIPYSSVYMHQ